MRFQLINLFAGYGARVKVVYVEKDHSVYEKQNREENIHFRRVCWTVCLQV